MLIKFVRRQSAALAVILAVAVATVFSSHAAAQPAAAGGAGGSGAAAANQPTAQQQVAEFLLSSINPGSETARYKDVMDAVTRALNNDGAGAQALLEQAAKQNPK